MIPPIIHQTWKSPEVPARFRFASQSWKDAHPHWEHRLWTDGDLAHLVRTRAPELLGLYEGYPDHIQRVDAARYVILREYGGLYADLDLVCLRPLDDLRHLQAVLPRTRPLGLSNQLMLARPGHRLFRSAVSRLPVAYARWQRAWIPRHFRVLATTGPLFITGCHHDLVEPERDVHLLSLAEHGHAPHRGPPAYVRHLPGDTWAAWDTHMFNFVMREWPWLALGASAAAGMAFLN